MTTERTLLEEFQDALAADVDESLTCRTCGAVGFEPCRLSRHAAQIAGFAAANARAHRIYAMRAARAGEVA